jgi:NAD(P)-dependent dehydrogenase (short-subunit alcohol dehydrogenase family)
MLNGKRYDQVIMDLLRDEFRSWSARARVLDDAFGAAIDNPIRVLAGPPCAARETNEMAESQPVERDHQLLAGRVALVTGASRGIGAALALQLAQAGAHVVAVARTVGGLEELDDTIRAAGGSATLVPLDLRDREGIARLGAALNERYGRLDVLVGNAAVAGPSSPLGHVEPKAWDEVIAVNLTANWELVRCLDPLLQLSEAGRVVFLTSGAATNARAYRGPYSVSKAALDVLARTYAAETLSTRIRVNLFNPGPTRTRMRATVMPGEDATTLPAPEAVAQRIMALCLPTFNDTGQRYDYLEFQSDVGRSSGAV